MAHNFRNDVAIDWCPGCGDFGILNALQQALGELNLGVNDVAIISGIGCSGKTPHYVNAAGAHTLHGRSIPYATGVKLSNPNLKVVVTGGDGDLMSIGAGHFVGEGRRNSGLTVILYDNEVYGLTKGQAAPTMELGNKTKSLTKPNMFGKVNPIALALTTGYTFVARGFSFDGKQLKDLIKRGISHEGSSLIDVLQPCPTYNNINTMEFYRKKVYKLEDDASWNPVVNAGDKDGASKLAMALARAQEWDDHIPTGVFYENNTIPSFPKRISQSAHEYLESPPAVQAVADRNGYTLVDPEATFTDKILKPVS
jgi:2-oxoglutarate ferredoxin oxidoreductase subunit beta